MIIFTLLSRNGFAIDSICASQKIVYGGLQIKDSKLFQFVVEK